MSSSPAISLAYSANNNKRGVRVAVVASALLLGFVLTKYLVSRHYVPSLPTKYLAEYERAPILISYAYFEKDKIQTTNMDYFMQVGCLPSASGQKIKWVIVSATSLCSSCADKFSDSNDLGMIAELDIVRHYEAGHLTLLFRRENEGMDLASHNITIEYMKRKQDFKTYKYFIFLNSSVRGPFLPAYMPAGWHWTYAFLARLGGPRNVHAISSSLVCLPEVDSGGHGPRLESWAFALDADGLNILSRAGTFWIRTCKLCAEDGIVTAGEYGISRAFLAAGANFTTLMSRYAKDTDWHDPRHWNCNDNVHPSRHGTYAGIAFHPFETVFVKSSWHVADPYTKRYTKWEIQHVEGDAGTRGTLDKSMYQYALSADALQPNLLEHAYASVTVKANAAMP